MAAEQDLLTAECRPTEATAKGDLTAAECLATDCPRAEQPMDCRPPAVAMDKNGALVTVADCNQVSPLINCCLDGFYFGIFSPDGYGQPDYGMSSSGGYDGYASGGGYGAQQQQFSAGGYGGSHGYDHPYSSVGGSGGKFLFYLLSWWNLF